MKRTVVVAIVAVALLMTAVNTALASSPNVETQFWGGEYSLDCGDFLITDSWTGAVKITYYWNPDGSLDRYHIHGEFIDQMSNPLNGKFVTGRTEGYNFFEDVADAPGVWKHAGLMFHVNVPGQGVVLIDAGYMIMYDGQVTYLKGKHQLNSGAISPLCAALR